MNERYRYGYGEEPGDRDNTFSRQGSMTEQRHHPPDDTEADVEQRGRGDEEDEEQRADRIREADADRLAPAPPPAVDHDQVGESADPFASTPSSSVFDVDEEAAEPDRPPAGERPAAGEPRAAELASDSEERPPIALGPPSRATDEAPATTTVPAPPTEPRAAPNAAEARASGDAPPHAAPASTATPTDVTPAAASPGRAQEAPPAGTGAPGTETEMLVPGSASAPVGAPADERSAVLASIDADGIRARFLDIQAGFVDEPRQAVQEAERFVDELVHGLVQVLENERAKLKATIDDGSTEDLRVALRGYRAFVDRLLNLTM